MERKQFTFYESFASALSRIKSKAARCDAYDAICNFALYGREPDIDSLPDTAAIAFELIRPTLEASNRKAENGKIGGTAKQSESKPKANGKQTANYIEKEIDIEKDKKKEIKEKNILTDIPKEKRFVSPTQEEAKSYFAEQGFSFNFDAWLSYYEQNGWMVGNRKMKDWKASMRYWQSKETPKKKPLNETAKGFDSEEEKTKAIERMKKMSAAWGASV